MSFVAHERGIEWERPQAKAMPGRKLPPLEMVLRSIPELDIDWTNPLKKNRRSRSVASKSVLHPPKVRFAPKLPIRRPPPELRPFLMANGFPEGYEPPPEEEEDPTQMHIPEEDVFGSEQQGAEDNMHGTGKALPSQSPEAAVEDEDLPFPWSGEELYTVFVKFDTDRDKEIHVEEVPRLLAYLGAPPDVDQVREVMASMTSYATLSFEEFCDFMGAYRARDIEHMRAEFHAADDDGSGTLDFEELHALLLKMGYTPTRATTKEAYLKIMGDADTAMNFRQFEALREHLRRTEMFPESDVEELRMLYNRTMARSKDKVDLGSTVSKLANLAQLAEEAWRMSMYLGYSANRDALASLVGVVDADNSGHLSFYELLKLFRLLREKEHRAMVRVINSMGDGTKLPREDLGIALNNLGYTVAEDAISEILEHLGGLESPGSLDVEEFTSLLRLYRRCEGFTSAELKEFRRQFNDEDRDDSGELGTLELGRVLRWFGFPRTLQEVQRLVADLDFDESGELEFTEFTKLMRRLYHEDGEKRRNVFTKLDAHKKGLVPLSVMSRAVQMITGRPANEEFVQKAFEALGQDANANVQRKATGEIFSVNLRGFEAFYKHYSWFTIQENRTNLGYSPLEMVKLKESFDKFDKDKSGTIEKTETILLINHYFPDAKQSKEAQQNMARLMAKVDTDGNFEIDFGEFVSLMRKCDDMRDAADIKREAEVIKDCQFTQDEVEGFRQVFSANANWCGELSADRVVELMMNFAELDQKQAAEIAELVTEVHPYNRDVARFPQFLQVIKQITEDADLGVREAAERVVRRENKGRLSIKAVPPAETLQ